jgi:hypothetical protein
LHFAEGFDLDAIDPIAVIFQHVLGGHVDQVAADTQGVHGGSNRSWLI